MKVATAFPPLNFKNTGKAWPAMTASAARLVHDGELSVSLAASQTARKPLAISSASVATPAARPLVRSTLVAPVLPLPESRTSSPLVNFTSRYPKGIAPRRYAMTRERSPGIGQ